MSEREGRRERGERILPRGRRRRDSKGGGAHRDIPSEHDVAQGIVHKHHDSAAKRPGAVGLVEALLEDLLHGALGDLQEGAAGGLEAAGSLLEDHVCNGADLLARELVEDHNLVQAVEHLGAEVALVGEAGDGGDEQGGQAQRPGRGDEGDG